MMNCNEMNLFNEVLLLKNNQEKSEININENSTNISLLSKDLVKIHSKLKDLEMQGAKNSHRIDCIESDGIIIGNQNYAAQYNVFSKKATKRIHELLGSTTDDNYVLFQPYFRTGIYKAITDAFDLSSWKQLSMINYEKENSDYNKGLRILETWKPQKSYFHSRLNRLITARDNGVLAAERCRALTRFLNKTDNAKNVPFIK